MKNFENDKDEICLECGTSEFCGCNYSFDPDDETFEPIYDDDTDDDDQNDDDDCWNDSYDCGCCSCCGCTCYDDDWDDYYWNDYLDD